MYGLPERIATSPAAYSPWILYSSRIQAIAMMMLVFLWRRDYEAVDTVMGFIGFLGAVDVWVCYREGVGKRAWERGVMSAVVAGYGMVGGTEGW
jgi:hypothetical protein